MSEITWKYVKPLRNKQVVFDFLQENGVQLPEGLVKCITENNGGRPSEKLFNTDKGSEYVFKSLLSYNKNDIENIYAVYPALFQGTLLYPFATDAAGNFICYDIASALYVLHKHETNSIEVISI